MFTLFSSYLQHYVSVSGQGSGIPQVKTVLSGVPIYKFLSPKTLLAKYFGLIGSMASGIGTGMEGPMIHISSMVAFNLGYLPFYRNIFDNPFYRTTL